MMARLFALFCALPLAGLLPLARAAEEPAAAPAPATGQTGPARR